MLRARVLQRLRARAQRRAGGVDVVDEDRVCAGPGRGLRSAGAPWLASSRGRHRPGASRPRRGAARGRAAGRFFARARARGARRGRSRACGGARGERAPRRARGLRPAAPRRRAAHAAGGLDGAASRASARGSSARGRVRGDLRGHDLRERARGGELQRVHRVARHPFVRHRAPRGVERRVASRTARDVRQRQRAARAALLLREPRQRTPARAAEHVARAPAGRAAGGAARRHDEGDELGGEHLARSSRERCVSGRADRNDSRATSRSNRRGSERRQGQWFETSNSWTF